MRSVNREATPSIAGTVVGRRALAPRIHRGGRADNSSCGTARFRAARAQSGARRSSSRHSRDAQADRARQAPSRLPELRSRAAHTRLRMTRWMRERCARRRDRTRIASALLTVNERHADLLRGRARPTFAAPMLDYTAGDAASGPPTSSLGRPARLGARSWARSRPLDAHGGAARDLAVRAVGRGGRSRAALAAARDGGLKCDAQFSLSHLGRARAAAAAEPWTTARPRSRRPEPIVRVRDQFSSAWPTR